MGGLVCDLIIDYFCFFFVETDNKNPDSIFVLSKTLKIFSRTNTANIKLPASPHRLTDKASDFESEDCGFESLRGRLFIIKSCAVFLEKPLKTVQILRGF